MRLTIDNHDGAGARDYTANIAADLAPKITRKLNRPSTLVLALVADSPSFVVPMQGGRVVLVREDDVKLFTGYLASSPAFEYLGWGERGPVYRYALAAVSDEFLLDRRVLPLHAPFIARTAGDALAQLTNMLLPGAFDLSGVAALDVLPAFAPNIQRSWSEHAAGLALRARAAYRAHEGAIVFNPAGGATHAIDETSASHSPDGLKLTSHAVAANDLTVLGNAQPAAHVKDYFLGDGLTLYFSLSHKPFVRSTRTLLDEEFTAAALDPNVWQKTDPATAITISSGVLHVSGGTGTDGQTFVRFVEKLELGGATRLQHGSVTFSAATDALLGGLYSGTVTIANCVAGFRIQPSGGQSTIKALINGAITGGSLTTVAGHRYVLSTRLYATEIYRAQQVYHSSTHPAGAARGGAAIAADMRAVLEVHDIDPGNPGSQSAAATVLYDGILANVPAYATYALVNALNAHCDIAFTRVTRICEAEVRSMIPSQPFRTRLTGLITDGAECNVYDSVPELSFFSQYPPVANEQIVVRYRSSARSLARVQDTTSIAALAGGDDDGVRAQIRRISHPVPSNDTDCTTAALALLDDTVQTGWSGEYRAWSDALPNGPASDVWPGDTVCVSAPSRSASFTAIVRQVEVDIADVRGDRSRYAIHFANDAAAPLGFEFETAHLGVPDDEPETVATAGTSFIGDLVNAEVTAITSITVNLDAGQAPPSGGGIEVRSSDAAWGLANDRNLIGRFATQAFSVTRPTRVCDFYLRQYDNANPPRYSRYSTLLHVDYPL